MGSREIVLVLGNVTLSDYGQIAAAGIAAAQSTEESLVGGLQALRDSLGGESISIEQDLADLNSLLAEIDELLASGEKISDEELRLMEEILSVIKDKSERYSTGR